MLQNQKNNSDKNLNINDIKVIQAPLAGISDVVFRGLIRKHKSKCLMTTEMISSEMLCNNPNPRIIDFHEFEYPLSFQLVGHKVDKMVKAAKIICTNGGLSFHSWKKFALYVSESVQNFGYRHNERG